MELLNKTLENDELTVDEVARIVGRSAVVVTAWRSRPLIGNPLPYMKIGKRIRYKRADVEAFLERCKVDPGSRFTPTSRKASGKKSPKKRAA